MSLLTALVLASLTTGPARADDDTKKAVEALQGEWKVVTFTKLNRDNPELAKKGTVVIADDKLTIHLDGKGDPLTFTLDPKADPPAIDFKAPQSKKTIRGIYKVDKDKLTICFGIEGSPRPTEFKSGRDDSIMVIERVKK